MIHFVVSFRPAKMAQQIRHVLEKTGAVSEGPRIHRWKERKGLHEVVFWYTHLLNLHIM